MPMGLDLHGKRDKYLTVKKIRTYVTIFTIQDWHGIVSCKCNFINLISLVDNNSAVSCSLHKREARLVSRPQIDIDIRVSAS